MTSLYLYESCCVRVSLLCVVDLNPCRTNPCLNGGICRLDRGDFVCLCPPQYHGKTCESGKPRWSTTLMCVDVSVLIVSVRCAVVLQCHYRNGGCLQYCRDLTGGAGVQCGCADGFILDPDGQSCSPTGKTLLSSTVTPVTTEPSTKVTPVTTEHGTTVTIVTTEHRTTTTNYYTWY